MLHTFLTTSWQLRYPIIGAPMAYVGRGRLARAVSQAGGLGMTGIGSKEAAIKNNNYDLAHIYAGEGVGLVKREQPAAEVIRQLGDGAEELLRDRCSKLLA